MCHYPRTLFDWLRVQAVTKWKEKSGAELVEAAVVIPVLLMLLLGIFTFGRAWNTYQTITRAAREGARELVLTSCATCSSPNTSYSSSYVQSTFVNPVLTSDGLTPSKVFNYKTIYVYLNPADPSENNMCGIQISFEYPFTFSLPFTSVNLSTVNLSTSVQMRMENQPDPCDAGEAVP